MAPSINFRPSSILALTLLACVVYATFASANPVPESADDITKQVLNDPVKAWKDKIKADHRSRERRRIIIEAATAQPITRLPIGTNQIETSPGFFEAVSNFDLAEVFPNSPFLRLAVYLLRALLIALILCLVFILAIQLIVCFANCCVCYKGEQKSSIAGQKSQTSGLGLASTVDF